MTGHLGNHSHADRLAAAELLRIASAAGQIFYGKFPVCGRIVQPPYAGPGRALSDGCPASTIDVNTAAKIAHGLQDAVAAIPATYAQVRPEQDASYMASRLPKELAYATSQLETAASVNTPWTADREAAATAYYEQLAERSQVIDREDGTLRLSWLTHLYKASLACDAPGTRHLCDTSALAPIKLTSDDWGTLSELYGPKKRVKARGSPSHMDSETSGAFHYDKAISTVSVASAVTPLRSVV